MQSIFSNPECCKPDDISDFKVYNANSSRFHSRVLIVNRFGCRRRIGDGVLQLRWDVSPTLREDGSDGFGRTPAFPCCLTAFCRRAVRWPGPTLEPMI